MNAIIKSLRQNRLYSWSFAILLGLLYRYGYGLVKDLFWAKRNLNFVAGIIDPNSKTQLFFLTVGINFIIDLSSVILPALICAAALIYIFHAKARPFSMAAVIPFLVFSRRAWYFWKAPTPGLQVSLLLTPLLGVIILFGFIFLKTRNEKVAEQGA